MILPIELIVLYYLRTQNVAIYVATATGYILIIHYLKQKKSTRIFILSVLFTAGLLLVYVLNNSSYIQVILDYANVQLRSRATGGSAYLQGMQYHSLIDMLLFAPIRFVYFLFGPFPWRITNPLMLLAFVESMAILVIFYLFIKDLIINKTLAKWKSTIFMIIFFLIGITASSLIDSNYGTAIRHKMNYVFVLFILASPHLAKLRFRLV